ncbi:M20 family metallopeptidase [Lysinibacillus telephonicus]|uniref:Amidohydrolase n=1 Tax=Lysinibacillus telephonicus TaxID=1714840 RepID=A0A431UU39_9BACI|nr:M20 family metallopeptidase [Lysinibacillus telephonicus]RTQ93815.1 amidohydrolase [Lysinibacillus telephonicus]
MEKLTALSDKITSLIDNKRTLFTQLSDQIWEFAETRFEEFRSSDLLCEALEKEGFTIKKGIAGLETGFIASYGTGHPVIAILGEYDALAGLSQQAGSNNFEPIIQNGNGHGCGHNLLGVGSLSAAIAVKDYMKEHNLDGTVQYFGCPAEESGYGKTFMARDGYFKDVDAAFSWHPATINAVMNSTANAVIHAHFKFKGRSAHAGAAPHLGRSALDAVELMNVGVNYMREHMIDEARIHYAVTNTGGMAPNVVQADAEVTYLIRAPKPNQVKELYDRVVDCARGAALMTQTKVDYEIQGSCHNLIPNLTLEKVMHQHMQEIGAPNATERDINYAKTIYETLTDEEKAAAALQVGKQGASQLAERPIADFIAPFSEKETFMGGSTDVADVSWNVPTAQCVTSTWAFGTPFHTWQAVAQGKESYAHDAMLLAGKAIACTAVSVLESPELLENAKKELAERLDGETYTSLIPKELTPPSYKQKVN